MRMHGPQVCDHVGAADIHTPRRPLAEVEAGIKAPEAEIRAPLDEVGE